MLSTLIVCYLFLGGMGAGACLVSAFLGLLSPSERISKLERNKRGNVGRAFCASSPYRRLIAPGFVGALVVLVVALTCLAADLGRADRIVLLLTHPVASYIAVGTYALIACVVLTALLACTWGGFGRWNLTAVRCLEVVAVLVAAVVMVYTGLMLQSLQSVPLWATPWLPILFALSSLSCGMALLLGVAQINGVATLFAGAFRRVAAADAIVIALEAIAVVAFVFTVGAAGASGETGEALLNPTTTATLEALRGLLSGANPLLFWGGFVGVGLVVPFAFEVLLARARQPMPMLVLAAAACVLVGGFALRFCIIEAGLRPVLMLPVVG